MVLACATETTHGQSQTSKHFDNLNRRSNVTLIKYPCREYISSHFRTKEVSVSWVFCTCIDVLFLTIEDPQAKRSHSEARDDADYD